MAIVQAPFNADQVAALKDWQDAGIVHPFTCAQHSQHSLTPTADGWKCEVPGCVYTQNWAHDFMLGRTHLAAIRAKFEAMSAQASTEPPKTEE